MNGTSVPGASRDYVALVLRFAITTLVLAVASAVRKKGLMLPDLRLDEAYTLWIADHPLREITSLLARSDTHPPLHYLLVHVLPGEPGAFSLRTSSVLFGALGVGLAAHAAHIWEGRSLARAISRNAPGVPQRPPSGGLLLASSTAVGLTIANPVLVQMSSDGRMYPLAAFALFACVVAAGRDLAQPSVVWRATAVTFATVAIGTHASTVPGVLAVALTLVVTHGRARRSGAVVMVATTLGGSLLAYSALLIAQRSHAAENLSWLGSPSLGDAAAGSLLVWGPSPVAAVLATISVLGALVLLAATSRGRPERSMLVAVVTASFVAPVVVSATAQALPFPRSVMVAILPAALSVGLATQILWERYRRIAFVFIILTATASLTSALTPPTAGDPSDFEAAASYLKEVASPDDLVVYIGSYGQLPIERYAPQLSGQPSVGLPTTFVDEPRWEAQVTPASVQALAQHLEGPSRVWLVGVRRKALDPEDLALTLLRSRCRGERAQTFPGVEIWPFVCSKNPA